MGVTEHSYDDVWLSAAASAAHVDQTFTMRDVRKSLLDLCVLRAARHRRPCSQLGVLLPYCLHSGGDAAAGPALGRSVEDVRVLLRRFHALDSNGSGGDLLARLVTRACAFACTCTLATCPRHLPLSIL